MTIDKTLLDVNRVEVIDDTGRAYVFWGEEGKVIVDLIFQDDHRTLKLCIEGKRR